MAPGVSLFHFFRLEKGEQFTIELKRRTIQSYAKFSRFSELGEGVLVVVNRDYFRSAICVFSMAQIL